MIFLRKNRARTQFFFLNKAKNSDYDATSFQFATLWQRYFRHFRNCFYDFQNECPRVVQKSQGKRESFRKRPIINSFIWLITTWDLGFSYWIKIGLFLKTLDIWTLKFFHSHQEETRENEWIFKRFSIYFSNWFKGNKKLLRNPE